MHPYCVRDVERLLQLSPSTIRALVARGFVRPARGPRREFRFSFQDLIVLRTARALALAKVPQRRISRSLSELRRHLPLATGFVTPEERDGQIRDRRMWLQQRRLW